MNIRRLWVKLALLFSVAVVIGFGVSTTLAYITVQSNSIVNTFDAPYFPPEETSVDVRVRKTVFNIGAESISPAGFQFLLQNTENNETISMVTDESGYACVSLPFSDADLGKTYTYQLSEINDGRENVTYSDAVYAIQITLSVNADNQITAAASLNGTPVQQIVAEFENIYSVVPLPPPTGDDANLLLYAVLVLISGAGMVLLTKRNGCVMK